MPESSTPVVPASSGVARSEVAFERSRRDAALVRHILAAFQEQRAHDQRAYADSPTARRDSSRAVARYEQENERFGAGTLLRCGLTGSTKQQEDSMTTDAMKKFVRDHFDEFVNKRNASVIRENMTPDFYDHDGPGGRPTDVAGDEQMMRDMFKAMPDLRLTIEDMVAENDKVVCRNIWRWTDPANGKRMQFHGFVLWRFAGDKIAERWATVTPPAPEQ